jgi:hypothetical protein
MPPGAGRTGPGSASQLAQSQLAAQLDSAVQAQLSPHWQSWPHWQFSQPQLGPHLQFWLLFSVFIAVSLGFGC